jgi:hypothetical protein
LLPTVLGTETLHAGLDVLLVDEPKRRRTSITEPGALPAPGGSRIQLRAHVNRPAYLYLVWLSSEGLATPVYPWQPGKWARQAGAAATEVLLPDSGSTWGIDSPAGVESVLLLVREEPLSPRLLDQLPGRLANCPCLEALPEPGRAVWFEFRPSDGEAAAKRRLDTEARPIEDPVWRLELFLREKLASIFSLVSVVSFAHRGKEGKHP